jgi:hypothetical protein
MYAINGLLLILAGLGVMGFGLFLFYAFLPLFYGLFGVGVGYWLGTLLTGAGEGEMSLIKLLFGLSGGVLFAGAAQFFEPIRRVLIGIGLGSLVAGLIASAIGLTGIVGTIIMIVGAVIGAGLTLTVFDRFIIIASAFGGAGLAMDGLHLILRNVDILDRTDGGFLPLVVWIFAGTLAMSWQFFNLTRWAKNAG